MGLQAHSTWHRCLAWRDGSFGSLRLYVLYKQTSMSSGRGGRLITATTRCCGNKLGDIGIGGAFIFAYLFSALTECLAHNLVIKCHVLTKPTKNWSSASWIIIASAWSHRGLKPCSSTLTINHHCNGLWWTQVFETHPGWVGKMGRCTIFCSSFNTSLAIGYRIAAPQERQLRLAHLWQNHGCLSAKNSDLARCRSAGVIGAVSLQYCKYKLDDGLSWLEK